MNACMRIGAGTDLRQRIKYCDFKKKTLKKEWYVDNSATHRLTEKKKKKPLSNFILGTLIRLKCFRLNFFSSKQFKNTF